MHHSFQLASVLDLAAATRVLDLLRTVPGIQGVHAASGANVVEVAFDEERTSTRQLADLLDEHGYPQKAARSHTCCGGCGG